ncbi:MAG: phage holin family protein [Candidatus Nanopelagicales bacterium]|jgi:uncharacterized membrane protein YvlD (DUF360 family)|nr:phage holin family protein [Candidatus Nanopelagicales bacterium]
MLRFIVNTLVYFAAAAIGLFVADMVLDEQSFSITYPLGFLLAAIIFALIQAILTPLFTSLADKYASMLAGATSLISALVALVITATISDDLTVNGFWTWFAAALIIWLASLVATLILKVTVVKKVVREVRD